MLLPVEKCTLTDKACMIPVVQKMLPVIAAGMPDVGVEPLDVLKMKDIKYAASGFQFSLSDSTLKGIGNAIIDDFIWDLEKKMFTVEFHTDATLKGHYTASGEMLLLPIRGEGQKDMTLKNLVIKQTASYDVVKNGNKEHFKLNNQSIEYDVKGNVHATMTNLFNGNKELSDAMLTFMNENWKEITPKYGRPLIDNAAQNVYENLAVFFEKLPIGDIANY